MKKILLLCAALIAAIFLTGCGGDKPTSDAKIKVVAANFPEYDWAREIIGGDEKNFALTLLMDDGVDLHSFQPSAQDIVKISECDVFIYGGGESSAWAEDALKTAANKNRVVVNLIAALGDKVKHEEKIDGMEADHDEHHDGEVDEHVWLSLKNAQILCDAITDALIKAAPAQAAELRANNDAYKAQLSALDEKYRDTLAAAQGKTILFGDRFPFRYLVDDYGLKYFAAFSGCSAESEASFQTIKFLAGKVDELNLPCVLTIDGANHRIAETIIANTARKDQKILSLDSLQSTTLLNAEHGATYLAAMEKNLAILRTALGGGE